MKAIIICFINCYEIEGVKMERDKNTYNSIDEYIATFPEDVQSKLKKIREVIRAAAPDAQERISYQMPTFAMEGNLVHFAAHSNHIGFYPTPSGIEKFKKELSVYQGAKGSVQFPLDRPIPYDLIGEIVKYRVKENLEKAKEKKRKRNKFEET
jgi:uncharacterized protein YdhG (YjbR/CyaY superfamily)